MDRAVLRNRYPYSFGTKRNVRMLTEVLFTRLPQNLSTERKARTGQIKGPISKQTTLADSDLIEEETRSVTHVTAPSKVMAKSLLALNPNSPV